MKLNPDFIPHDEFHKGFWLKTPRCDWFFFLNQPRKFEIPTSSKFYTTLDDGLKDLVQLLHKNKIPTTPSCTGHIQNKDKHIDIFDSINGLKDKVKKDGVIMFNPETSGKFFYKNPKFSLPFSRNEFLERINEYEKWGVLGIVDNQDLFEKIQKEIPVNKLDDILLIFTKGDTQKKIDKNWSEITKIFKDKI
jgi:hypothetical protein